MFTFCAAKDKIIAAIAIGGVLNLGGGSFNAAASGIRATDKSVGLAIMRKSGTKMTIGQAIKNAGKAGRSAASDRLAFEYGGVKALEKMSVERIVMRKLGGSVIGVDGVRNVVDAEMGKVIVRESGETTMIRKVFGKVENIEELGSNYRSGLADFSLMIRGGRPVKKESVETFVYSNKLRKSGDVMPATFTDDELKTLTRELDDMRVMHEAGDLIDDPAEQAITGAITAELKKSGVLYEKLIKSYRRVVLGKEGKIAKMKALVSKKAITEQQQVIYEKEVDRLAVDIYKDIMKTANQLPGDVAVKTSARGRFVNHFEDAWGLMSRKEAPATQEIMKELEKRAVPLVKGVPLGGGWPGKTKIALMTTAGCAAWIAMETDASLEKYGTCGGSTMCLHFPAIFGKDNNNEAYQLDSAVKSEYKGLVMGVLPSLSGGETDRFHIMSPCKTDLVVEAHAAGEGFCKCEELSLTNEVIYKLQRISCVFKDELRVAPINADGTCPKTYTWKGTEYEIEPKWYDWNIMFSCDVDEDQEECIYKEMHDDPCTDDKYDDNCLKDEYRNCYGKNGDHALCRGDIGECDSDGHCTSAYSAIGSRNGYYPPVALSLHQDTFPAAVNLKENVNTGLLEPVTICRNSWSSGFLGTPGDYANPCVSVAYDVDSMRGYSKGGFGMNYCAENGAQFIDGVEGACFWGGIVGAVAVSAMSGGVTGTVIVPVAVGSASVACEKLAGKEGKWPHDQY